MLVPKPAIRVSILEGRNMSRTKPVREVLGVSRQSIPNLVFQLIVVIEYVVELFMNFFLLLNRVLAFALLPARKIAGEFTNIYWFSDKFEAKKIAFV
jgi:hypothetical protein